MTHFQRHTCLAIVTLLCTTSAAFAADYYEIDPEHTSVVFSTAHNGLSYTYGMFRKVQGQYLLDKANPNASRFQMSIRADSLDTNNADRDTHLRSADFFDVQQFPEITFDTTGCEFSSTQEGVIYKVTGTLNIHGVPRQVTLNLRMLGKGPGANGKDERTGFLCQLELKRSDFKMNNLLERNLVGDAVGITVSFEGIQKTQPTAPPAR